MWSNVSRLSIYEVRLRDTIRMRKKIQKAHWRPIWQHCRKIQQDEKSPEIYLNGSRIGWAKAWKEIRRNKFHLDDATAGQSFLLICESSQFVFDDTGTSPFDTGCLADSKLPPLPPGVVIKPRRSSAPPSPTSLPPALANITTFYGDVLASAPRSGQRDIIRPAAAAPASLQLIRLRRDAGRISHIPHSMTSSTSPTESPVTEIQPSVSSRPENDALRSLPLEVFYNTEIVYESRFRATSSTDLSGVDLEERWKIMCFHGLPFLQLLEGIRSRFQPLLS